VGLAAMSVEMEIWLPEDAGSDGVPSQSCKVGTRPMKTGGVFHEEPSTIFLCKDSTCIRAVSLSKCRDCDGALPPKSPQMNPPAGRRYAPYPTPLLGRLWTSECSADCQPCPERCEDLTEQCTPGCVQVAVPCLDTCLPPKDCTPDTCPETLGPHSLWAASDWHAHCNLPPQFAPMNIQFNEELQQLVMDIRSLAHIGANTVFCSLIVVQITTIPKTSAAFLCPLPMHPARKRRLTSPSKPHMMLAWPLCSGPITRPLLQPQPSAPHPRPNSPP
jgi:hypothetical protein